MQIVLPKWIFSSHFQFGRGLDLSGQKGHSYASIHGLRTYSWFEDALYDQSLGIFGTRGQTLGHFSDYSASGNHKYVLKP